MRSRTFCLLVFLMIAVTGGAVGQLPPDYSLEQNDPDPFCGETVIIFALPVLVEGTLAVWDPDSTSVVRTLVHGMLQGGYYLVSWDQRDDQGSPLPNGVYPYVLTAVETPGEPPAFVGSKRATVDCPTSTRVERWGRIRELYRERGR